MDNGRISEAKAETIYGLLSNALSPDAPIRVPAERHLLDAENDVDFFASLASIASASDTVADPTCKWLAATCAKNAVKRSWRRYHNGRVTEEERKYVRGVLLGMVGTKRRELREQVTEWIARISRLDFPTYWPELLERIVSFMSTDQRLIARHAVEICDAVVEQLASKRLKRDRMAFESAAPGIMRPVLRLMEFHVGILVRNFDQVERDNFEGSIGDSMEILKRLIKIARRLMIFGYGNNLNMEEVSFLFEKLNEFPQLFFAGHEHASDSLDYISILAAKLIVRVFDVHPLQLSPFLPRFLPLFASQIARFSHGQSSVVATAYALRFLRDSLQRPAYKINRSTINEFSQLAASVGPEAAVEQMSSTGSDEKMARSIVLCYFAGGRLRAIVETILSQIMVLSPRDLVTWESDPEEWLQEEEIGEAGDSSDWSTGTEGLRFEAQELINAFVALDRENMAQALRAMNESLGSEGNTMLKRDALYRAIGTVTEDAPHLYDLQGLFKSTLSPMLAVKTSSTAYQDVRFRVVMARAAWLIGRFGQTVIVSDRGVLYDALISLLSLPDVVVAFNAVRAIRVMIEYTEPGSPQWGSRLGSCIHGVVGIIHRIKSISRKRELLRFLDIATDKANVAAATACLNIVAQSLGPLWENGGQIEGSADDGELSLLRISIVVLATELYKKLGAHAIRNITLRSLTMPMIRHGTNISTGGGGLYMMEDACELWAALIAASEEYSEDLNNYFPCVKQILENDYDNLKVLSHVIQGYALLGGEAFMQSHGKLVAELLEMPMGYVRDRGVFAICDAIDVCLQLFGQNACALFMNLLCLMFTRFMYDRDSQVVSAAYDFLILRAAIYDWDALEQYMFSGNEEAIVSFVRKTIEVVDIMYLARRRKLAAVALCGIIRRNAHRPALLEQMPAVLNVCVQILAESKTRSTARQRRGDYENYVSRYGEEGPRSTVKDVANGLKSCIYENPEAQRRQKLCERDVPVVMDVGQVTREMIQYIKARDENVFNAVIANTDTKILEQLERFCGEEQKSQK